MGPGGFWGSVRFARLLSLLFQVLECFLQLHVAACADDLVMSGFEVHCV